MLIQKQNFDISDKFNVQLFLNNPFDISSILEQEQLNLNQINNKEIEELFNKYFENTIPDFQSAKLVNIQLEIVQFLFKSLKDLIKKIKNDNNHLQNKENQEKILTYLNILIKLSEFLYRQGLQYQGIKCQIQNVFPQGFQEIEFLFELSQQQVLEEIKYKFLTLFIVSHPQFFATDSQIREKQLKIESKILQDLYEQEFKNIKLLAEKFQDSSDSLAQQLQNYCQQSEYLQNLQKESKREFLFHLLLILVVGSKNSKCQQIGYLFMIINQQIIEYIESVGDDQENQEIIHQNCMRQIIIVEYIANADEFVLEEGSQKNLNTSDGVAEFVYTNGKLMVKFRHHQELEVKRVELYSDGYCEINSQIGFYISQSSISESITALSALYPYFGAVGASVRVSRQIITNLKQLGITQTVSDQVLQLLTNQLVNPEKFDQNQFNLLKNKIDTLQRIVRFCTFKPSQKTQIQKICLEFMEKQFDILLQKSENNNCNELDENKIKIILENTVLFDFLLTIVVDLKDSDKHDQQLEDKLIQMYQNSILIGLYLGQKINVNNLEEQKDMNLAIQLTVSLAIILFQEQGYKGLISKTGLESYGYFMQKDVLRYLKNMKENYFLRKIIQIFTSGEKDALFGGSNLSNIGILPKNHPIKKLSITQNIFSHNQTMTELLDLFLDYLQCYANSGPQDYNTSALADKSIITCKGCNDVMNDIVEIQMFKCNVCNTNKQSFKNQTQYALTCKKCEKEQVCLQCAQIFQCHKCFQASQYMKNFDWGCDSCDSDFNSQFPFFYCTENCDFGICYYCWYKMKNYCTVKKQISCQYCIQSLKEQQIESGNQSNNQLEQQQQQNQVVLQYTGFDNQNENKDWNCIRCGLEQTRKDQNLQKMYCNNCQNNYCMECVSFIENEMLQIDNVNQIQKNFQFLFENKNNLYAKQIIPILTQIYQDNILLQSLLQTQLSFYNFKEDFDLFYDNLIQIHYPELFTNEINDKIEIPIGCLNCKDQTLHPKTNRDIRCKKCRQYFGGSDKVYMCLKCDNGVCQGCAQKMGDKNKFQFRTQHCITIFKKLDFLNDDCGFQLLISQWILHYQKIYQYFDFGGNSQSEVCNRKKKMITVMKQISQDQIDIGAQFLKYTQTFNLLEILLKKLDLEHIQEDEYESYMIFKENLIKIYQENIILYLDQEISEKNPLKKPKIFDTLLSLIIKINRQLENFTTFYEKEEDQHDIYIDNVLKKQKSIQQEKQQQQDKKKYVINTTLTKEQKEKNNNKSYHISELCQFYFEQLLKLQLNYEDINLKDIQKFTFFYEELTESRSYFIPADVFQVSKDKFNSKIFDIIQIYVKKITDILMGKYENIDIQFCKKITGKTSYYNVKILKQMMEIKIVGLQQFDIEQKQLLDKYKKEKINDKQQFLEFQNSHNKSLLENYLKPQVIEIFLNIISLMRARKDQNTELRNLIFTFSSEYILNENEKQKVAYNMNLLLKILQQTQSIEYLVEHDNSILFKQKQQSEESNKQFLIVWVEQNGGIIENIQENSVNYMEIEQDSDDEDQQQLDQNSDQEDNEKEKNQEEKPFFTEFFEGRQFQYTYRETRNEAYQYYSNLVGIDNKIVYELNRGQVYSTGSKYRTFIKSFVNNKGDYDNNSESSNKKPSKQFLLDIIIANLGSVKEGDSSSKDVKYQQSQQNYIFEFLRSYMICLENLINKNSGETHNYIDINTKQYNELEYFKYVKRYGVGVNIGINKTNIGINPKPQVNIYESYSYLINKKQQIEIAEKFDLQEQIRQLLCLNNILLKFVLDNPIQPLKLNVDKAKNQQQPRKKWTWDVNKSEPSISISNKNLLATTSQGRGGFKSVIGNYGFTKGIHYWELTQQKGSQDIKYGVTTTADFNLQSAFCDFKTGYGLYNRELRHESNSSGSKYCDKGMKDDSVLGVCLNMQKGQLSFSIDGEYLGIAYDDPELKKGPIYPAIAMLSEGGVLINSQAKIPKQFQVSVTGVESSDEGNKLNFASYIPLTNNQILQGFLNLMDTLLLQFQNLSNKNDIYQINNICSSLYQISSDLLKLERKQNTTSQKLDIDVNIIKKFIFDVIFEKYSDSIFNEYGDQYKQLKLYISQLLTIVTDIAMKKENLQFQEDFEKIWTIFTKKIQFNFIGNYRQTLFLIIYHYCFINIPSEEKEDVEVIMKQSLELEIKNWHKQYLKTKDNQEQMLCPQCNVTVLELVQGPYKERGLGWNCNVCRVSGNRNASCYNCQECEYDLCEKCHAKKTGDLQTKKENIFKSLDLIKQINPALTGEVLSKVMYQDNGAKYALQLISTDKVPKLNKTTEKLLDKMLKLYVEQLVQAIILQRNENLLKEKEQKKRILFDTRNISSILRYLIKRFPIISEYIANYKVDRRYFEHLIEENEYLIFLQQNQREILFIDVLLQTSIFNLLYSYQPNLEILQAMVQNPVEYKEVIQQNGIKQKISNSDILQTTLAEKLFSLIQPYFQKDIKEEQELIYFRVYVQIAINCLQGSVHLVKIVEYILEQIHHNKQNKMFQLQMNYIFRQNNQNCAQQMGILIQNYIGYYKSQQFVVSQQAQYQEYYFNEKYKEMLEKVHNFNDTHKQDINETFKMKFTELEKEKVPEINLPINYKNCLKKLQQFPSFPEILGQHVFNYDKKSVVQNDFYQENFIKQEEFKNIVKIPQIRQQFYKQEEIFDYNKTEYENNEFYQELYNQIQQKTLAQKLQIHKQLENCTNWRCQVCNYKNYTDLDKNPNCEMCETNKFEGLKLQNQENLGQNGELTQEEAKIQEEKEQEIDIQQIQKQQDPLFQNITQQFNLQEFLGGKKEAITQDDIEIDNNQQKQNNQQQNQGLLGKNQQKQQQETKENEELDELLEEKDWLNQILDLFSYFTYLKEIDQDNQQNNNDLDKIKQQQNIQKQQDINEKNSKKPQSQLTYERIFRFRQEKVREAFLNNSQIQLTKQEKIQMLDDFELLNKKQKQELLIGMENSLIKQMSMDIYKKADKLKRPLQLHDQDYIKDYDDSDISSLPDIDETNDLNNAKLIRTSGKNSLFSDKKYSKEADEIYSDFQNFNFIPVLSDKAIFSMIYQLVICSGANSIELSQHYKELINHSCQNHVNNYRIYDTLLFLMTLRKEDFQILKEQNHEFCDFFYTQKENQQINMEDLELKFIQNITQKLADKKLFSSSNLYGHSATYRGIFSKYLNLQFLEQGQQYIIEECLKNKISDKYQLEQTKKARELLIKNKNINDNNNEYGTIYNVLTIFQNNQNQFQAVVKPEFWKELMTNIVTNKNYQNEEEKEDSQNNLQTQEQLEFQDQDDSQVPPIELLRRLGTTKETSNVDKNQIEKDKKFPKINYLQLFTNNQDLFQNFCQNINDKTLHILQSCINADPTQFSNIVKHFFENISIQGTEHIDQFLKQGQEYQKNFYINNKSKNFNQEQSIDKQIDDTDINLYTDHFWQELPVKQLIVKCNLFKHNLRYFMTVLYNTMYPKMILYKKINQIYTQKETELKNLKLKGKENIEKKKQIQKDKEKDLKECKKILKKAIITYFDELEPLRLFLRNFIEIFYFYFNFMSEKNFKNELLPPMMGLLIIIKEFDLSYAKDYKSKKEEEEEEENLKKEKQQQNQNQEQTIKHDEDEEFPDDMPELSKLITQRMSSVKMGTLKIKNNISKQQQVDTSLEATFEMLFSKIYPLITHINKMVETESNDVSSLCSVYKDSLLELKVFFAKISLEHASQFIPMIEKLEAIKKMANEQALKTDPTLRRQEKHNTVVRSCMWSSTLQNCFLKYTPAEIVVHDLRVKFEGECGLDWGGLKNEWLALLSGECFHPDYGLFMLSPNQKSVQPNPLAYLVPEYLTHFRMLGRLVAKAVIENWNLEVSFSKSFLKHVLNKELYVQDLEDIDPELTKNLMFILQNDIGDGESLYQPYSYGSNVFGRFTEIELKKNGFEELVNQQNKKDYAKDVAKARMTDDIKKQTQAFKKGMTDIIPQKCLQYLSEVELQRHLSGIPTFDESVFKQMKKYAKIEGYNKTDQNIIDFFEVLHEFSETMRANFLFFLTGSFKINFEGFKRNPLRVSKVSSKGLPVAHTCFNQVELPVYNDKNLMRERLKMSILYGGGSGFQIV